MSEIILLALLGPFALLPTPGRFVALLLIPAWWAWRWVRGGQIVPRTPLNAALLLLAVMVLAGLFVTFDLSAALSKIAGLVYGVGVYYAAARACRGPRPLPLWVGLGVFLLGGAGVAVLALLGTQWPLKFAFLDGLRALLPVRLGGLPGAEVGLAPNEVAGTLLWVLPLALVLTAAMLRPGGRLRKRLGVLEAGLALLGVGGAAALMLAVLVLTQSRAGLAALGLTVAALLLVAVRRRRALVVGGLAGGVGAAVLTLVVVGPRRLLQIIVGLGSAGGGAVSLDTVEGRVALWARAVYAVQDFPYSGLGLNHFRTLVHLLYPTPLFSPAVDVAHAHNLWLQAAVDLGLPGLVAYLALWLGAAAMLLQVWRAGGLRAAEFARPLVAGLGGGLLAHFLFGLTDAIALGAKPGVLWWLMLGLIAGLHHHALAAAPPGGPGVARPPEK